MTVKKSSENLAEIEEIQKGSFLAPSREVDLGHDEDEVSFWILKHQPS